MVEHESEDIDFGVELSEDEVEESPVDSGGSSSPATVTPPPSVPASRVGLELEPRYSATEVPTECRNNEPVVVGIDEAGRGPVVGDLVYALAYFALSSKAAVDQMGFDDSKKTTAKERESMLKILEREKETRIGHVVCDIPAETISTSMMLKRPMSLNELSQQAAIGMVKKVIEMGVNVAEIYVDAVGNCDRYEERLRRVFPNALVKVCPKADALYKVVSAASIIAKTRRDNSLTSWIFREHYDRQGTLMKRRRTFTPLDCTGYPGDPKTVAWMRANADPVFGYPSVVRHSWKTTRTLYGEGEEELTQEERRDLAAKRARGEQPFFYAVEWEKQADGQVALASFMQAVKRPKFFQDRRLQRVEALPLQFINLENVKT